MSQLSFFFTEESFCIDSPEEDYGGQEELKNAFQTDRYPALFQLGFAAR